jgi:hypothetical protein
VSLIDKQGKTTVLVKPGCNPKAIVDTGYRALTLPDAVYQDVRSYARAGAFAEGDISVTAIDCAIGNSFSKSYTAYTFESNGFTIDIPIGSLLLDLNVPQAAAQVYSSPWNETCCFAMDSTQGNKFKVLFLGATFLKSVYANSDLSNNQISLAQATFYNASAGQMLQPRDLIGYEERHSEKIDIIEVI